MKIKNEKHDRKNKEKNLKIRKNENRLKEKVNDKSRCQ